MLRGEGWHVFFKLFSTIIIFIAHRPNNNNHILPANVRVIFFHSPPSRLRFLLIPWKPFYASRRTFPSRLKASACCLRCAHSITEALLAPAMSATSSLNVKPSLQRSRSYTPGQPPLARQPSPRRSQRGVGFSFGRRGSALPWPLHPLSLSRRRCYVISGNYLLLSSAPQTSGTCLFFSVLRCRRIRRSSLFCTSEKQIRCRFFLL